MCSEMKIHDTVHSIMGKKAIDRIHYLMDKKELSKKEKHEYEELTAEYHEIYRAVF